MINRLKFVAIGLLLAAIYLGTQLNRSNVPPSPIAEYLPSGSQQQAEIGAAPAITGQSGLPSTDATPSAEMPRAVCVDGDLSGRPFADVDCLWTVTTLSEAAEYIGPGSLVVVRAFPSDDPDSIRGVGTYRGSGLQGKVLTATAANPIIIQAEEFEPGAEFTKPIIDGALRIQGMWERTPGTNHTWQTPLERMATGFIHWACIDRIWVSRLPGKTELADFPLTRPIMKQGGISGNYSDCENNTDRGRPITPVEVDSFPGSYVWLDGILFIRLPGGEDPNEYTVEVPYHHPFSLFEQASGLVVRGFRVYHSLLGIDLYSCGTSSIDRCEASHNEASFNFPFGLQTGPYSYLHHNTGILNTIQLIKITQDFSEVSYNIVGPQLSHGFKLLEVRGCIVQNNEVFGNNLPVPETGTQAGWKIIGTRDRTVGIYLNVGTQECELEANVVYENRVGFYIESDDDKPTRGNLIQANWILDNEIAIRWRGSTAWRDNFSNENFFSPESIFRWKEQSESLSQYAKLTGMDKDSQIVSRAPADD